jgi:ATP-dependent RNA helicase DHX37/DHR1
MSATLRVSDFSENATLFASPPPVVSVAARQHPVTVHFARRTDTDYVGAAVKKAAKIHARLPPGGILIFLTGQNEISGVVRKLESRYGKRALEERKKRRVHMNRLPDTEEADEARGAVASAQADVEAEDMELGGAPEDLAADVDDQGQVAEEDEEDLESDEDEELNQVLGIDTEQADGRLYI